MKAHPWENNTTRNTVVHDLHTRVHVRLAENCRRSIRYAQHDAMEPCPDTRKVQSARNIRDGQQSRAVPFQLRGLEFEFRFRDDPEIHEHLVKPDTSGHRWRPRRARSRALSSTKLSITSASSPSQQACSIIPGGLYHQIQGNLGVALGSLWGHFGVTLGSLWGHFGVIIR